MLALVVLAVTCSVVAVTFVQLRNNRDRANDIRKLPRKRNRKDGKEIHTSADRSSTPKEEEAEVKRVSSFSSSISCRSFQESDQLLLPEFDELFQGGLEFPSDSDKSVDRLKLGKGMRLRYESDDSVESKRYESNSEEDEALEIFEALTSSNKRVSKFAAKADRQGTACKHNSAELAQLKATVAELQEKEITLEAELLEYYGLKEQERSHLELERQLRKKNVEIDNLAAKLCSLEYHKKTMLEGLAGKENLKVELEAARIKIKDLQNTMQNGAGHTKAQLLILKQQVAVLQEKEQARSKDFQKETRLQTLKELEVDVVELRRTSKVLKHQNQDLTVRLGAAQVQVERLANTSESDLVAKAQDTASTLRLANEGLGKQVEGLQMTRFSEVEELVYLRWVNACLRYELRNFQAAPGKITAAYLGKNLSPKSQEKAKQLMLEYAGPDLLTVKAKEQSEQDCDSVSSLSSTPSEHGDFEESSFDGQPFRHSGSKRSRLIGKLRKWGRPQEGSQRSPSTAALVMKSSPGRTSSPTHVDSNPKGSLEGFIVRSNSESVTNSAQVIIESDAKIHRHATVDSSLLENSFGNARAIRADSSVEIHASSSKLVSKSDAGILEQNFQRRHKLAVSRDKSDQAMAKKLIQKLKAEPPPLLNVEKGKPRKLSDRSDLFSQRRADGVLAEQNAARPVVNKIKLFEIQKRAPRVAKPPPKAAARNSVAGNTPARTSEGFLAGPPPLPPRTPGAPPSPPPPPGSLMKSQESGGDKVQRSPEVVEFYRSLMKRETRQDSAIGASHADAASAHNNIIGEIENRSSFLLAVKADVETQGDFIQSLATEILNAAYHKIEDVVAFVCWLDEELSFLVDERAVLKHFEWPESKADTLREASFEYQDLKNLEDEISSFEDDLSLPCESSLKNMLSLLEKTEQSVYALLRTRDMAISRYKDFSIPTQWMLDSGLVGKIKLATVQLARMYMKRVASELDASAASPENEPQKEFMLLQGVRFAFRVHQFAGGFDAESMHAFEELRNRVHTHTGGHPAND